MPLTLDKGYVALHRTWKTGDTIELESAHAGAPRRGQRSQVAADRGRVALERGPIVYAAEWPDNPNGKVRNLMLPDAATLTAEFRPDLLERRRSHDGQGRRSRLRRSRARSRRTEQPFTAIPYYAWANRGRGQMIVWIPDIEASARPAPFPTVATTRQGHRLGQPAAA